jgi:hypothetical protein
VNYFISFVDNGKKKMFNIEIRFYDSKI